MLTMEQLDEFREFITSGRAERNFLCASEKERIDFLELLEKFMDIADEADKLATTLIFRGRLPGAPKQQ